MPLDYCLPGPRHKDPSLGWAEASYSHPSADMPAPAVRTGELALLTAGCRGPNPEAEATRPGTGSPVLPVNSGKAKLLRFHC